MFITGPRNGPVLFCSPSSVVVVCHLSSLSVVVCNAAGGTGVCVVGRAADTARRASTVTSR